MNTMRPTPRVQPGSPEVFGPKGPPSSTMTPQGEAFVQQLMAKYQAQLAAGNQTGALQTLREAQPFLRLLGQKIDPRAILNFR